MRNLEIIDFNNKRFVSYVDENRFIWIFSYSNEDKKWKYYMPSDCIIDEWQIEYYPSSHNRPVKLISCGKELVCAFLKNNKDIRISSSNDGVQWKKLTQLNNPLGINIEIVNLNLIFFNEKLYLFCLNTRRQLISVCTPFENSSNWNTLMSSEESNNNKIKVKNIMDFIEYSNSIYGVCLAESNTSMNISKNIYLICPSKSDHIINKTNQSLWDIVKEIPVNNSVDNPIKCLSLYKENAELKVIYIKNDGTEDIKELL